MRQDLLILILVILADIVLVIEVLYFIIRRNTSNKLIQAAFENDENKFEKVSASLGAKTLSDFDKKLIRYNVADIRKDQVKKEALIREFGQMELTDRQKKQIYPKIFYHYIDRNRKQEAKAYYQKLSAFNVFSNKKDIEMTYDAYVAGGHQYLDEALRSLKRISKQDLPARERLIARLYENKGIHAEAKKYERLAERHEAELKKR